MILTVTSQVHSILRERYGDADSFTSADIKKIAPWLEDERKGNTQTSRVSAALCYLCRIGAILCVIKAKHRNVYITDNELLAIYKPQRRCKLGHTKPNS